MTLTNPMQMAWSEYRDHLRVYGRKATNFGNLLKRAWARFRREQSQAEAQAFYAAKERDEAASVAHAYRALPRSQQIEVNALREQLAFRQEGMLSGNHGSTIEALKAQINAVLFPRTITTQTEAA